MEHETFWTLLRDIAHWQFEIFLMLLVDGLIVGICGPFVRKHWRHHIARDMAEELGQRGADTLALYKANLRKHMRATAFPDCEQCEGEAIHLDTSVIICKECGHVTIPK